MRFLGSGWAIAAVAAFSLSAFTPPAANAEDVKSADTLVKGLAPVKTRGFDPTAPAREAKQHELNTKLREFKTRQITVEERAEVAKLVEESKSPNVDVQILFAFDSADILPEARPALDELGKALSDPKLKGGSFLIAGHTDAKGSDDYNLASAELQFPVLPPPFPEGPEEYFPGKPVDDTFDAFHAARAWYSYAQTVVPPPRRELDAQGNQTGEPLPWASPRPGEYNPFIHRMPRAPALIIFRQQPPRAQSYLAERLRVELPITRQMHAVLKLGKSPMEAVRELMERSLKEE